MSETQQAQYKETIPLWLAVAITVLISVPFSLWLGAFNFAVWCSFIVWAEYFALGAKPAALKTIIPSFAYSAVLTGLTLAAIPLLAFLPTLVTPGDLAVMVALFVGVAFMVYSMRWAKVFEDGSLPFFNGISMVLAIYFTGSYPQIVSGPLTPLWAAAWAILMAIFGGLLGVFNVWLTFPKKVESPQPAAQA
ncbi:MAG: hypothetical protein CVT65_12680 [Actinobacteria bacterium HGW-Actinobacteria-5]|jgi:hypothetical protein|nr:MAG: hypothetical protein CVT65_12680 [Actinobacteria bacterium HGW-Actinobacteria-5]